MITLTEAHIKELEAFIQELPTKYGMPLIQFLNKAAQATQESAVPTAPEEDKIED